MEHVLRRTREALMQTRLIILDGAMGTELEQRGFKTKLPIWSAQALIDAPELVLQIHQDYCQAGASIITTNTFRTNPYTIIKAGLKKSAAAKLTALACDLARAAVQKSKVNRSVMLAGSIAPVEDCFSPQLYPGDFLAEKDHYEHIKNLKNGGVDFILAETMISIKEALIVLKQAKKLAIDAMVSFALNPAGNILNGDNLITALKAVLEYQPMAFLINCTPLLVIEKVIDRVLATAKIPIGIYPNFGPPLKNSFVNYLTPKQFAQKMFRLGKKGVKILGGCCGTRPAHIAALSKMTRSLSFS